MSLTLYQRPGSAIWHYRGTVAGRRLRGSTRTSNKERAEEIAAKVNNEFFERRRDQPQEVLTFPKAAAIYLAAGKPERFIKKVVAYWKNIRVKDITAGAIQQAAIDLYPDATNASRNRLVIVPTQAIINHCADLGRCSPIFEAMQKEIWATTKVSQLQLWAEENKDRLGSLKPDWQDFLRGVYAEHRDALRQLDLGDDMRMAG